MWNYVLAFVIKVSLDPNPDELFGQFKSKMVGLELLEVVDHDLAELLLKDEKN